jgi:hypothetical protein
MEINNNKHNDTNCTLEKIILNYQKKELLDFLQDKDQPILSKINKIAQINEILNENPSSNYASHLLAGSISKEWKEEWKEEWEEEWE